MKSADDSNRNIRWSSGLKGELVHIRIPSKHPYMPHNKPVRVSAAVKAVKRFVGMEAENAKWKLLQHCFQHRN